MTFADTVLSSLSKREGGRETMGTSFEEYVQEWGDSLRVKYGLKPKYLKTTKKESKTTNTSSRTQDAKARFLQAIKEV